MPLETIVNYIDDLNKTWPIGTIDTLDEADDHLRNVKAAVQGSFTNLGQTAVTLTAAQINTLPTNVAANALGINPIGAVIMFNAIFASIPTNWQLCDGTNGTPNMTDRFVYGTNTEAELLNTGGSKDAVVVQHTHTFTGVQLDPHTHKVVDGSPWKAGNIISTGGTQGIAGNNIGSTVAIPDTDIASGGTPAGTNSTVGVSGTDANLPPYVKLAYIQRMS